jgi:hypothetical protein
MSQTPPPGSLPPPKAVRVLPVWQSVSTAYASLWQNLAALPKAAFLPFVLSLGLLFLFASIAPPEPAIGDTSTSESGGGPLAFLRLLILVPYVIFGVAWHRQILLGHTAGGPTLIPPWRSRHWRFLGYSFLLFAVSYGVTQVLNSTAAAYPEAFGIAVPADDAAAGDAAMVALAVLVFLLTTLYLTMRFVFVFPAVAVDEQYGLIHSWRHTRGQGLRLVAAFFLTALPISLASLVVASAAWMLAGGGSGGLAFFADLVNMAFGYVVTAVTIGLISTAFRHATGWIPGPTGGPPTVTPPIRRSGEDSLDKE